MGHTSDAHGHHAEGHHGNESAGSYEAPLRPGYVRLQADFAGSLMTASHYLDMALPLDYDIPISVLLPVLNCFEAEGEVSKHQQHGEGAKSAGQSLKGVWADLQSLLSADASAPESESDNIRPIPSTSDPASLSEEELLRVASAEKALEVDYQAKQALVEKLTRERDAYKEELERLKQGSDHHHTHGSIFRKQVNRTSTSPTPLLPSRALSPRSEGSHFSSSQSPGGRGKNGFSPAKTVALPSLLLEDVLQEARSGLRHERQRSGLDEKDAVEEEKEGEEINNEVDDHKVWLDGCFSGSVTTKDHVLDVALPVVGPLLGTLGLEACSALSAAAALTDGQISSGEPLDVSQAWSQLATLISPEYPKEESLGPRREDIENEELLKALLLVESLRAENKKVRSEADILKSRNTSLTGHLALAERSANELRSTIRKSEVGGLAPALSSPTRRTRFSEKEGRLSPAASPTASTKSSRGQDSQLVKDLQELERWARALRTSGSG
mmetsp:Transcript_1220/g.2676  ORF Transcript_1220/g.2676 Transcript_1220/m.2676 type:complete len:498 (+) Transcript_1220:64-1557(+)